MILTRRVPKHYLLQPAWRMVSHTDCVAVNSPTFPMDLLLAVQGYFKANINVTMNITTMDTAPWTTYVRQTHSEDALAYGHSDLGASYEPIFAIGMLTTNNSANVSDG